MRHADVTLDDKFLLTEGRVFITGVQALLRVLVDQHRLDAAAGLKKNIPLYGAGFLTDGTLEAQGTDAEGLLTTLHYADGIDTPRANEEWAEFRALERGAVLSSFHYHYARLIEKIIPAHRQHLRVGPVALGPFVQRQSNSSHASCRRWQARGEPYRAPRPCWTQFGGSLSPPRPSGQ